MSDLKNYRNNELKNYVIGNVLLILLLSGSLDQLFTLEIGESLDILKMIIESALISSIIYIYVFLLDSLVTAEIKKKIVYFPIGKMPGYNIFTNMKDKVKDDRFTKKDVMKKYKNVYDNMPTDKKEREKYENAQWYKIYNKYENESKILTANRDFLLCRDMTIITLMLILIYIVCFGILKVIMFSWETFIFLIIELIVTDVATRGKAHRLAYNVISEDVYKDNERL